MPYNFEMLTTRTGDGGRTSDFTGRNDWKNAPVFALLGDLDELGSWLGVLTHLGKSKAELLRCQDRLLVMGSLVATDPKMTDGEATDPLYLGLKRVTQDDVEDLERWEKALMNRVTLKPVFVLPGGTKKAAWCDVARTVCRRAERSMVGFVRAENRVDLQLSARWLNRLSDALFVQARCFES